MTAPLEHNLGELASWIQPSIDRLTPAEQRKLLRKIGQDLRRVNRERMAAQTDPDGTAWEPRKEYGRTRRGRPKQMMRKLRQAKRLRVEVGDSLIRIGWRGHDSYLASVHHFGLTQRLQFGMAHYPERPLLGITEGDAAMIQESLLRHLQGMTS